MGRVGNCLLTTFRVCQFFFSLIALACGAFSKLSHRLIRYQTDCFEVTYKMYDLAELAADLELALNSAMGSSSINAVVAKALKTLSKGLLPVLQYLQSVPIRAIALTVVVRTSSRYYHGLTVLTFL